jgi:predicted nucleic acid-binding protein
MVYLDTSVALAHLLAEDRCPPARVAVVELSMHTLSRALEPFPVAVRTLDAIHLASMDFLQALGQDVALASYDQRMRGAARKLGFEAYPL